MGSKPIVGIITNEIINFSAPVWKIINDAGKENKFILFEGAQGILLDVDQWYISICNFFQYSSGKCLQLEQDVDQIPLIMFWELQKLILQG